MQLHTGFKRMVKAGCRAKGHRMDRFKWVSDRVQLSHCLDCGARLRYEESKDRHEAKVTGDAQWMWCLGPED